MDTELLRTFLEVKRTRHFGKAAENLHLTQSAVSARIRHFEETLGVPLFSRARNNIQLTSAGQKLARHAEAIINTWTRARQEIALSEEAKVTLSIGGLPSLWDILLQGWLDTMHQKMPELALNTEAHGSEVLIRRLLDHTLDLAFLFESPQLTELNVEEVAAVQLTMVSSREGIGCEEALAGNYVFVDWGTAFSITHARAFPDAPAPSIRMGLGRMAHSYILENGGTAYLELR